MFEPIHERLAAVYRNHGRELYVCAMSVVGCPQQAEDAIHDAFVGLFKLDRPPRRLKAYVFRCVRNAALDICRRNDKRQTAIDSIKAIYRATNGPTPTGLHAAEQVDARQRLAQAMATLDQSRRDVIILHCSADLKFREIARVLDRPMGTVTAWYRRGLQQLRERLNEP